MRLDFVSVIYVDMMRTSSYTQAFAQVCCIVIHIQIYSGVLYKFKYFLHYCGAMLAQHNYVWQKKKSMFLIDSAKPPQNIKQTNDRKHYSGKCTCNYTTRLPEKKEV